MPCPNLHNEQVAEQNSVGTQLETNIQVIHKVLTLLFTKATTTKVQDLISHQVTHPPDSWATPCQLPARGCSNYNYVISLLKTLEAVKCSNKHTKHLNIGFQIPFSNKKNQGSLEKWLVVELRQGKYNTSLKHLVRRQGSTQNTH